MLQPRKGSYNRPLIDTTARDADPRVVCPIRTSTDHQIYGLQAQEDALHQHATRHHYQIHQIYPDQISAKETPFMERPSVQQMLQDMEAEGIKKILVTKVDRAFRKTADFLLAANELHKRGLILIIADLNLDTSTPHGRMVIGILAQLGEWELSMRSERQLAAFEKMRQHRLRCAGPIRYGWEPADPHNLQPDAPLKPVPEEQQVLHQILLLAQQGLSPGRIKTRLHQHRIPKTYRRIAICPHTQDRILLDTPSQWSRRGIQSIIEHAELAPEAIQ